MPYYIRNEVFELSSWIGKKTEVMLFWLDQNMAGSAHLKGICLNALDSVAPVHVTRLFCENSSHEQVWKNVKGVNYQTQHENIGKETEKNRVI